MSDTAQAMLQEGAKLQGVRTSIADRSKRVTERRTLDERLLLSFPAAFVLGARTWSRLPLGSRLRRRMLTQSLRRMFAALNRRDLPVFLLGFDPHIEFRVTRDFLGPDQAEVSYGHKGLAEFLQAWFETFEDFRYEPEEVLDLGDKLLVTMQLRGTGKGSGVAVNQRTFVLSHVQRGWVVKQETFLDRSTAFKAAGLQE